MLQAFEDVRVLGCLEEFLLRDCRGVVQQSLNLGLRVSVFLACFGQFGPSYAEAARLFEQQGKDCFF